MNQVPVSHRCRVLGEEPPGDQADEPTAINSCLPMCTHIYTHIFLQEGRVEDRASDRRPTAFAWIGSRYDPLIHPLIHPSHQAANTESLGLQTLHSATFAHHQTRRGQSQHNPYPLCLPSYLRRESHLPCDFPNKLK